MATATLIKLDVWPSQTEQWFCILIKAQLKGSASLPYQLGLSRPVYQALLGWLDKPELDQLDRAWQANSIQGQRAAVLQTLANSRSEEIASLETLLTEHARSGLSHHSAWLARIIAVACMAPSHLWTALGLSSRGQLRSLLEWGFPSLAALNTNNMRWKRFFYRQLCQQGGDYVCRAPSCEECSSYDECFES